MKAYISILFLFLFLSLISFDTIAQVPSVINVEIDYMVETGPGAHSHRPQQEEINAVIQMFACRGITLNVVIDDELSHRDVMVIDPDDTTNFFDYDDNTFSSFGQIKQTFFDNSGGGWHYCVFGHQFQNGIFLPAGNSGKGEWPGDDFVVTLGGFAGEIGTPWDRASTFAHELGHNLGLGHAGAEDALVVGNYKPNLPSIMSYFYQLTGVRTNLECQGLAPSAANLFKNLDYSDGRACTLNENGLNEDFGMGMKKVDWNCSGSIGGIVAHDLSNDRTSGGWCAANGTRQILSDYNEWASIVDVTSPTIAAVGYRKSNETCVTYDEYVAYANAMGSCTQPTLETESCVSGKMRYVKPSGPPSGIGSCGLPHVGLGSAYGLSGDGDILYFAAGTYPVPSGTRFTKRMTLAGPGGIFLTGQ